MKLCLRPHYLVLVLSVALLFSCKKDDAPITIVVPEEKPTLFEQIQGKWIAEIEYDGRISNPSPQELPSLSSKVQDMPRVSAIEFLSDSTYLLTFNHYRTYLNKFSIKDSSTLLFKEFGDVSNIKIVGDSISFTFSYHEISLSVKAAKTAKVNVDDTKKALLKEWILTREEDGANYYQDASEDAKISYIFTSSGSFGIKSSIGEEYYLYSHNWKWHNTKSNGIITYRGADTNVDYTYNDYYKIVELSNSKLKLQLIEIEKEYDNQQNIIGTKESVRYTLVFTAK